VKNKPRNTKKQAIYWILKQVYQHSANIFLNNYKQINCQNSRVLLTGNIVNLYNVLSFRKKHFAPKITGETGVCYRCNR